MKKVLLFFALMSALCGEEKKWVVFYGDQAPVEAFNPFQVIVLEPESHVEVKALRERNKTLLGYLSLGEIEKERFFYEEAKKEGLLGKENTYWKGSYFVDITNRKWRKLVIEELIPRILHKGFSGLFLDTLDNTLSTKETREAAIELVKTIRLHYPEILLMVNRGYELFEEIGKEVDILLAEDLLTLYDFEKKEYRLKNEEDVQRDVAVLNAIREKFPKLQFFSLDFWNPEDKAGIESLYERAKELNFNPYVSTIDLQEIVSGP